MYVKMVQASLPFGYEYLGNQPRLVGTTKSRPPATSFTEHAVSG